MPKSLYILVFAFAIQAKADTLPTNITLATTNWCPYACEESDKYPGIIHDYITQLLQKKGINVTIKFYPWAKAINLANSGKVDGLLTAVKSEAPDLLFTSIPTDYYQMCFFTRKANSWVYTNVESLKPIKVGIIDGYGYGEPVDSYVQSSPDNIRAISGGGIPTLNRMLSGNRFDTFIDDSKVVRWSLKANFKDLRLAGCLEKNPFYLAIHPDKPWSNDFVKWLDFQLKASRFILRNIQDAYY